MFISHVPSWKYNLIYESVVNVNHIWRVWLLPFDYLCPPFPLNHVISFKP
ncbi:MAG: hypothetical protein ACTS5A_00530 [Candidatus Hodgkinia cicadicola]